MPLPQRRVAVTNLGEMAAETSGRSPLLFNGACRASGLKASRLLPAIFHCLCETPTDKLKTSARDKYMTIFTVEDEKESGALDLLGEAVKCCKSCPRDILLLILEQAPSLSRSQ